MSSEDWSVWVVDTALVVAILEAAWLVAFNAATGRGLAWRGLIANLAAGLCLMVGIRVAVGNAAWPWIALCVGAAGIAHGLDLWRRMAARRTGG